jgi:diadenosine tetraphosphate (Ap4A) HIT family hydrolase
MPENWKSKNWDALISGELCPVCDLIRSDAHEDEHLLQIFDLTLSQLYLAKNQFVKGYCVLICRRHVIEPYELSRQERAAYFDDVALAAEVLQKVFTAHKMNYNILGNVSPHLHTHILPRYFTDSAPNRPIDPALKGHEMFLTASEYKERINLIADQIQKQLT